MGAVARRFNLESVVAPPGAIHLTATQGTGEWKYEDAPEVNLEGISPCYLGDCWPYLSSWAWCEPAPTVSSAWSSW